MTAPIRPGRWAARLTIGADGLLDGALGAFALWTLAYHVALLVDLTRDATVVLWLVLLVVGAVATWRFGWGRSKAPQAGDVAAPRPIDFRGVVVGAVALGAAAAVRVLHPPGWWVWWVGAVAVAAWGLVAVLRARPAGTEPGASNTPSSLAVIAVAALALTFAVLSLLTQRPDGDDVFLLNRATYVEAHDGEFPTRDTIFADQQFEAPRAEASQTAIEPMVGVVAAVSGLAAPTVAYLVLAPAVSGMGILALWRLLRSLRAELATVATLGAGLFLFLDGSEHASFGNFTFGRAWQGKVAFVFVVVPLLWHHALRWGRDGERRSVAGLVAANLAGIGLTSTAAFVGPAITIIGVAAGRPSDLRRYAGAAGAIAYPLAVALAAALATGDFGVAHGGLAPFGMLLGVAPPVAGAPGTLDQEAQWYTVLGDGFGMFVGTAAVLLGWAAVRSRSARLALAVAPLAVLGVVLVPGVLDLLDRATGAGSILWRSLWIVPLPAMVGLLLVAPLAAAWRRRDVSVQIATATLPVLVLTGLAVFEVPVTAVENGARFGRVAWDVDQGARQAATTLLRLSERGDVVAAPERDGGVLSIVTADVHPVNPRDAYMNGRHATPEFHAGARRLVSGALSGGLEQDRTDDFVEGLDTLSVDTACSRPRYDSTVLTDALIRAGFMVVERDDQCTYWRRIDARTDGGA